MTPLLSELAGAAGLAARVCVGLVLFQDGAVKLRRTRELEGIVAAYRILPSRTARPAARALPSVEIVLGLALLVGPALAAPCIGAAALLAVFAWAMAINLKRGRAHISCGCGGAQGQAISWLLVGRNLTLAGLLFAAAAAPALGNGIVLRMDGLAAGSVLFLTYLLFNTLAALPGYARATA